MKILVTLVVLAVALVPGQACAQSGSVTGSEPGEARVMPVVAPRPAGPATQLTPATDALHAAFTAVLADHVQGGVVDYAGLGAAPERLDAYLAALGRIDPERLGRDETFAFWINAYNAFTLRLILDHHGEIDSIKDISSGKRWKHERWVVNGKTYSLDAIEHEILRPLGDARIHFALNCASVGCPDLRDEAYLASRLDEQLADATRRFLADERKGLRVVTEKGFFGGDDHKLYLSSLFDWFEEDFERDAGTVIDYVLPHAPAAAAAYIRRHREDLDVEHLKYDWTLNGR